MPSEAYNRLGLRVGKTDSTGSYSYVCDGTSPASPVLSDGHALYTPGLSENRGGVSAYYSFDRLGNLWTLDGSSKSQLAYEDNSGFGGITSSGGSTASVFKFSGGVGGQSDADTGLVLLGHRYYDGRQGRFISQDPAGEGDNWYAYADNSPTNEIDPDGLFSIPMPMDGPGSSPSMNDTSVAMGVSNMETYDQSSQMGHWTWGVPEYHNNYDGQDYNGDCQTHWVPDMDEPVIANTVYPQSQQPESLWHYLLRQLMSGGQADGHHLGPPMIGPVGGEGGSNVNKRKAANSLEKRIAEHEKKLQNYKDNPDAYDNDGRLGRAGSDADQRNSIINGRIQHIQNEIDNWKEQVRQLRQ